MKAIKRFDSNSLSRLFGLGADSDSFIYKSVDKVSVNYPQPHRKEMYSLGLVTRGTAELRVGLDTYHIHAPGLVSIAPDDVRLWNVSERLEVTGLFFKEDFVLAGLTDTSFLKRLPFYQKTGNHFIQLNPDEFRLLASLFEQIGRKHRSTDLHKEESIQAILRVLLLEAINLQGIRLHDAGKHSQAHVLTQKFKALLADHFTRHREIGYYADQLSITPKHLSQTVKEQTGKTASELIDELVCLEAKILLQVEAFTIAQVSQQLNFANPSFFGKFFKRSTGMSPQQYRQSLPRL